jgi:hypothetical protein
MEYAASGHRSRKKREKEKEEKKESIPDLPKVSRASKCLAQNLMEYTARGGIICRGVSRFESTLNASIPELRYPGLECWRKVSQELMPYFIFVFIFYLFVFVFICTYYF